ncbi:MAG TPA: galactose oxidase-like domain-containing protein [Gemmatimonadales bacterium]|nr:galactose oxidase-like domain-containing protein [Gemmatimonadales bacterium]
MRGLRRLTCLAASVGVAGLLVLGCRDDDPPPTAPELATVVKKTLTVKGSGTGDGVVTSSPAGINCTITKGVAAATGCVAQFQNTLTVTLSATPKTGSAFLAWFQYCQGYQICQAPMNANRTVQARFMKGPFLVKIGSGAAGPGKGTVRSQAGLTPVINCTIDNGVVGTTGCQGKYPANTELILTATPAAGSEFWGWGDACGGTGTCVHKPSRPLTIPATFGPTASPVAATQGKWSPVFQAPVVAIHMHLLSNGKVAIWGERGEMNVWDPADPGRPFVPVAKTYQLFCSGHTILPDGRLFVAGGHISHDHGLSRGVIYDPSAGTWTETPRMARGRWYPTTTVLPNGDVLTVAGADEQAVMVPVPEIWRNGAWHRLTGAALELPYYPPMFVAPNGLVFMAGPAQTTRYIDPSGEGSWTTVGDRIEPDREAGTAVMYAPGKVLYAGGGDPPTRSAEVIDLNEASPAWRAVAPMAFARRHTMATLLADGQVLVTHGTSGPGFNDVTNAVHYAELWNPATEAWTTLAREQVPRVYHANAILLPDATVLSTGSGEGDGIIFAESQLSAQIFRPPYLFNGDGTSAPRPVITSAPARVSYGESFSVETPDAASVSRGNLIRIGSATHSLNMSQVIYPLELTPDGGGGLTATAPEGPELAPPGPYMLFLLDDAGVPSVAAMVAVGEEPASPYSP